MFNQTIETSAAPHVTVVESTASLVVRGVDQERITIQVQGGNDDVRLEREGEDVTLSAGSDCTLICPRNTTLTIHAVQGNLRVVGVEGPVTVGTVHGNLDLRTVGLTRVEQAFGNLRVRRVLEDLHAEITRGNARVHGAKGLLSLGQVDGNLTVEGARAGLAAGQVRGNVRLGPPFSPGATYRLSADGNLALRLPSDASIRLTLDARGGVRSLLPDLVLEEEGDRARAVLGSGEAGLEAQVGGRVSLRPLEPEYGPAEGFDFMPDLEGLGAQIEARVAQAMAEMEARLGESLGRIDGEHVRRRIDRSSEQFRRTAEREAERARLRAERAERRWQRASGHRPRPRRPLATDEERMRVLRLVEEGRITPDQAADLLAALEGR